MSISFNGTGKIDGTKGKYDQTVQDSSVRYGRNSVDNQFKYMEKPLKTMDTPAPILDFSPNADAADRNVTALENFADSNDKYLKSLPPLEFEYRYMNTNKAGEVDKKAVLGAAYEEMRRKEIPVKEFDETFMFNEDMSSESMDINKDGKVDIAEYGANILATDVLSKDTTDITKIDGTVNNKGLNAIVEYTKKANAQAARELYTKIYNTYDLGSELKSFNPEG